METKKTAKSYSREVKERAVRLNQARGRARFAMAGDLLDRGQDRLQRGNPAEAAASPPATPLDDCLHPRLPSSEGDRDAAGKFKTLPQMLPVPGGDKE